MIQTPETVPLQNALVTACLNAIRSIKEIQRTEDCQIMQHALTNLVGELTWCVREFTPANDPKPKKETGT